MIKVKEYNILYTDHGNLIECNVEVTGDGAEPVKHDLFSVLESDFFHWLDDQSAAGSVFDVHRLDAFPDGSTIVGYSVHETGAEGALGHYLEEKTGHIERQKAKKDSPLQHVIERLMTANDSFLMDIQLAVSHGSQYLELHEDTHDYDREVLETLVRTLERSLQKHTPQNRIVS